MEPGNKVTYQYLHSLNKKSKTLITKQGVIIRRCHTRTGKPWKHHSDYYIIQLDGNKNTSKIHISKLTEIIL